MIAEGRIGDSSSFAAAARKIVEEAARTLWVLGSHVMNLIHYFGGEPSWCFAEVLLET